MHVLLVLHGCAPAGSWHLPLTAWRGVAWLGWLQVCLALVMEHCDRGSLQDILVRGKGLGRYGMAWRGGAGRGARVLEQA